MIRTVRELIERLQQCDEDTQVRVLCERGHLEGIKIEEIGDDKHYVVLLKNNY